MEEALFAADKASWRVDADGRLHIALCRISKATVNPYYGREIPNCEALGLDPSRVYRMWRPAEELAKAAPTFNNIQVLSKHVAVSVDAPQEMLVAGSTGTDAVFTDPYLMNSIVIWRAEDIEAIKTLKLIEDDGRFYLDFLSKDRVEPAIREDLEARKSRMIGGWFR